MTLEEQLKQIILSKYKNVSRFASAVGLPNSTIDSIINRKDGVTKAGVQKIIKIFALLNLDVESIDAGTLSPKKSQVLATTIFSDLPGDERELIFAYREASPEARRIVDLTLQPYRAPAQIEKAM